MSQFTGYVKFDTIVSDEYGTGPSFSKHLKSVTMVTCLSPKFCSAK